MPRIEGIVADWLRRKLGGLFSFRMTSTGIFYDTRQILVFNPDRVAVVILNQGTVNLWVDNEPIPFGGPGRYEVESNDVLQWSIYRDFLVPTQEWYAHGVGLSPMCVMLEVFRVAKV